MAVVIDGTLGVSLVQDGSVTFTKLAANSVDSSKIIDASIAPADLNGAQSGSAPIYACRAWCTFDGTLTGTNAPAAGGNISSVTRNGAGDYTVNFSVAMPNANYAISGTVLGTSSYSFFGVQVGQSPSPYNGTVPSVGSFRIGSYVPTVGFVDSARISIIVFC